MHLDEILDAPPRNIIKVHAHLSASRSYDRYVSSTHPARTSATHEVLVAHGALTQGETALDFVARKAN